MHKFQIFDVAPSIPPSLAFLEELARNLWWSWHDEALELFRRISPALWKEVGRNPLLFLTRIGQKELEALSRDKSFLAHLNRVRERFDHEVRQPVTDAVGEGRVAYFSLEYGIHESLRLYSGGLGVLAGDHLKAASDVGVPLAAVGLLYRQGYFQQYLNDDGWQQERYPEVELHHLPVTRPTGPDGQPLTVAIPLPEGVLHAAVWRVDVGRIPLYLLDANVPENTPELRNVTAQLYGGDRRLRLRQELLLGIGGHRALIAAGFEPEVCHINEGHAAFLAVARIEHLTKSRGLPMDVAQEIVRRTNVFTTHTPVPAGNETFHTDLAAPYLAALQGQTGVDAGTVIGWGNAAGDPHAGELSMTVIGLRMSQYNNAVSELHGRVARTMWQHLWPNHAEDETPITHVTNGVHVHSWIAADIAALFDRYIGPIWREDPSAESVASRVDLIPDEELWRAHEVGRARLIRMARQHVERQYAIRNAPRALLADVKSVLDHDALTIGFARRFATYKRGTLLMRDRERLAKLLSNSARPVQILLSGKAHPADDLGKDLIRQVVHFSREAGVCKRVIFLENYDINLARYLVQGVDVWLNTPRRPHEASGTSGMKSMINGGLHASTLDGWWCEGYSPDCGWAIGAGEEFADSEYQDSVESQALYNLLEEEIVPCYYEHASGAEPTRWIGMMKKSIAKGLARFTSRRMIEEYHQRFYRPAGAMARALSANDCALARAMVVQRQRLRKQWNGVRADMPGTDRDLASLHVGDGFTATSVVHLGELRPEDVNVEIFFGPVDSHNRIVRSNIKRMEPTEDRGGGRHAYVCRVECESSGRYGLTARVVPSGDDWKNVMPGFITWADGVEPARA